ncbi:sodium:calcium antiporter [Anatilimnocola sp. NA78]|uniref:sodium:calcium antiporter n=1 Tax=Anatilimnocola sp. NA78 TaxID=3415683 RepID=UPI003CE4FAC4
MLGPLLQFLACAAVIIVAGTFLAFCADAIAEITKLGRLVVGSVLLAGATSLPELTVDISAIRMNMPDLAVGDLLGSCLANLLILALLDLSTYSRGKMLSKQAAAHALSGSLSAALLSLVTIGLLTGKAFADYQVVSLSIFSLLIIVAYLFGVRLVYLDQRIAAQEQRAQEPPEHESPPGMTLTAALLGFAACAGVILLSGPFMAEAAGKLAEQTGLGKTFVGTTLVAISTSLPELVSSIAALRMGALDLAIGNVFGSNAFNILLLAPLDLALPHSLFAAVSQEHVLTCTAAIFATMVVIMGQLYRSESRVSLIEPDAWLVICIVVGAMALLYYLPK